MSLAEEIAAALANTLAPIVDNAVSRVAKAVTKDLPAELADRLSGKEIKITLPDMRKPQP